MTASTFADLLRDERLRANLSQGKLADWCSFDHSYVSRLEAGTRNPSRETVLIIGKALGLDGASQSDLLLAAGFADELHPLAADVNVVLLRLEQENEGERLELLSSLIDAALDWAEREAVAS